MQALHEQHLYNGFPARGRKMGRDDVNHTLIASVKWEWGEVPRGNAGNCFPRAQEQQDESPLPLKKLRRYVFRCGGASFFACCLLVSYGYSPPGEPIPWPFRKRPAKNAQPFFGKRKSNCCTRKDCTIKNRPNPLRCQSAWGGKKISA